MLKIDIYPHIVPKRFFEAFEAAAPGGFTFRRVVHGAPMMTDLDLRLRIMDRHPDYLQVLVIPAPPIELATPQKALELAQLANEEMAELVDKYPDRFIAAAAIVPLNNVEGALKEIDRAVNDLGMRGIVIPASMGDKPVDSPEFFPIYERLAKYNLPIWIHPSRTHNTPDYESEQRSRFALFSVFGWPYDTTIAMARLVFSGLFDKYPNLHFITHHCGGMVPYFADRMKGAWDFDEARLKLKYLRTLPQPLLDYFRNSFYNDTALYGSTPALMCGHAFFGAQRLAFGTDMPLDSQLGERYIRDTIRSVEEMPIPDAEKKLIFEDNARRLLRLPV